MMKEYGLFINGRWQSATGGGYRRLNPATEQEVVHLNLASREDAEQAVRAARESFESRVWSGLDPAERSTVLLRFADLLMDNQEDLARLECETQGAPLKFCRSFINSAANTFRYFAGLARDLPGHAHSFGDTKLGITLREPIGVASLILPWNFPIGELAWKLGPALAAGCSVVVKPDSKTAATCFEAGPLLSEAGLPDGVFNALTGDVSQVGEVLTSHPEVDAVSFTGSSGSGRVVMRSAAESVKPLHLELGGKSPLIVLDDADLEAAASDAAFGIFWHNGQVCTACSRLLVHEKIYSSFVEAFINAAAGMRLGDPLEDTTDLGPMIGPEHLERVHSYIDKGVAEGAELLLDGRRSVPPKGAYLGPTVFTGVLPQMLIAREEIFGPVACVLPISNLDQGIQLANDTEYGLGAGIWTKNLNAALSAARRLRSGSFWVNGYGSERLEMPWGGYKQSGFGRELGKEAFEVFTQTKSVHITQG